MTHQRSNARTIFAGFGFGMLLQLAVGPVCLFILQAAAVNGFLPAEAGVGGVTVVDAAYIGVALLGAGRALRSPGVRRWAELAGALVIAAFGVAMAVQGFGPPATPDDSPAGSIAATCVKAALLTAASPLTILFWVGIFSSRIAERSRTGKNVAFAAGCVLSTLVFLSAVAGLGSLAHVALPRRFLPVINVVVGLVLAGIGIWRAAAKGRRVEA